MADAQPNDFSLVAAIDLGSNSFHMVLARVDQGEIRILERLASSATAPRTAFRWRAGWCYDAAIPPFYPSGETHERSDCARH